MRSNQPPKYLNTSDSELYHKRSVLFGLDLARASAARAARMILVEGYTDVLALHQAGLRNCVGIMGTSLTEEQIAELERVVAASDAKVTERGVLELCLDADRAGQDAMLRAARLAAGRKLELRVAPMPEGMDPADLVAREGADRLRERVEASVPFVVFDVDRILARADTGSAEGKDRAIAQLRPVFSELPPSVLREDLLRRVAGRLELSERTLGSLIADGRQTRAGSPMSERRPPATIDPAVRTERGFLILCIALPEPGRRALAAIDPEQHLTSERLRRAARHLAGQTEMPLSGLAPDDEELAQLMADLVARAERAGDVSVEQLEQQRLLLERARLERAIRRAREQGGPGIGDLAREREHVMGEIRAIDTRMEKAV
jgi:DNA primase